MFENCRFGGRWELCAVGLGALDVVNTLLLLTKANTGTRGGGRMLGSSGAPLRLLRPTCGIPCNVLAARRVGTSVSHILHCLRGGAPAHIISGGANGIVASCTGVATSTRLRQNTFHLTDCR